MERCKALRLGRVWPVAALAEVNKQSEGILAPIRLKGPFGLRLALGSGQGQG